MPRKKYKTYKKADDIQKLIRLACINQGKEQGLPNPISLNALASEGPFCRRSISYWLKGERLPESMLIVRRLCELAGEDFGLYEVLLLMARDERETFALMKPPIKGSII